MALDEPVLLTDHPSPVIRCHVIEAVLGSAAETFLPRMLTPLSDTAMVTVHSLARTEQKVRIVLTARWSHKAWESDWVEVPKYQVID